MGKQLSICAYQKRCAFFARQEDMGVYKTLKKIYCQNVPLRCEILKRHMAGKQIPNNMLPDGTIEAQE
jgi:hypothetical protein